MTTDGRYVRLIECEQVPNTITADPTALAQIEGAFAHLCRLIPDRQSLVIYAQTDPVPIDEALASRPPRHRGLGRAGPPRRAARARARRASGCSSATTQTVIAAAGAEQPAVAARWWVAVPYRAGRSRTCARRFAQLAAGARGKTLWQAHREAAIESLRLTDQIDAALRRARIDTWLLDGTQALALLWERLHPAAAELPDSRPARRGLPDRRRDHRRGGRPGAPPDPRGRLRLARRRRSTLARAARGCATRTGRSRR